MALILTSCPKPPEQTQDGGQQPTTQAKKQDEQPKRVLDKPSTDYLGSIQSLKACCFDSPTVMEYLKKGAGIIIDNHFSAFDVTQLIAHAKEPRQVLVDAKNYNNWSISDFAVKGAQILVDCKHFSDFEIRAFIKNAKTKGDVTINATGCFCANAKDYTEMGARIIVNKLHPPFNILTYIDVGKERVEVVGEGFQSNWLFNFLRRGGTIRLDGSFDEYHVYEFVKEGHERVKILSDRFSLKSLKTYIAEGAKVMLYKHTEKDGIPRKLKSFETAELIKIKPANVTVVSDSYEAHEIAEFIKLGAKVIFKSCNHNVCNMQAFLDKVEPPLKQTIAERNKALKQRKNQPCYDKYYTPDSKKSVIPRKPSKPEEPKDPND